MNCESAKAQLIDYLSCELSETEHAALAAHLAGCADCRAELQATQRTWQTLGQLPAPDPSENLRPAFYAMLASFKKEELKTSPAHSLSRLRQWWQALQIPQPLGQLAYGLGLVGVGMLGGYWLNNQTHQPTAPAAEPQLTALVGQVAELRQVLLLSLIDDPSATERLRAVSYTKELAGPNARVVAALLSTLNHDPNVNVRLATLEALAPLAPLDPAVRLGLVQALPQQTSPLVQSALADVMVQLQERRSVRALRALLRQANLDETVKSKIEQSIQTLSGGSPAAPRHSLPPSSPQTQEPQDQPHEQTYYLAQPERLARLA